MSWFTNDGGLQVHEDGSGDVLSRSGLTEESVEGIVPTSDCLVTGHLSIGLDSMFQAVKLPAGVADLNASLSDVHRDTLTLQGREYPG